MLSRLSRLFIGLFSLISATIILSLSGCSTSKQGVSPGILKNSVVIKRGDHLVGTGIVVRSSNQGTFILTNKHICDVFKTLEPDGKFAYEEIDIKTHEVEKAKAKVLGDAENADLCMLHSSITRQPYARLSKHGPEWGDYVEAVGNPGNPFNSENIPSAGIVGGRMGFSNMRFRLISMAIYPGNSGSGVYNADGFLVGVVSVGTIGKWTMSGMVEYDDVKEFLKKYSIFTGPVLKTQTK